MQEKVCTQMKAREEARDTGIVPWSGGGKKQRSTKESFVVSLPVCSTKSDWKSPILCGLELAFQKKIDCNLICAEECWRRERYKAAMFSSYACAGLPTVDQVITHTPEAMWRTTHSLAAKQWSLVGSERGYMFRIKNCLRVALYALPDILSCLQR